MARAIDCGAGVLQGLEGPPFVGSRSRADTNAWLIENGFVREPVQAAMFHPLSDAALPRLVDKAQCLENAQSLGESGRAGDVGVAQRGKGRLDVAIVGALELSPHRDVQALIYPSQGTPGGRVDHRPVQPDVPAAWVFWFASAHPCVPTMPVKVSMAA